MIKKYLETAMILSRMYGIAETLNPWAYVENEKFLTMIKEWTEEFMNLENDDILQFFESKIKQ